MPADRGHVTRRRFLGTAAWAVLGSLAVPHRLRGAPDLPHTHATQAALIAGETRADNVHQALRLIEKEIQRGLAHKKRIVIKPNLVVAHKQLAATHVECMEAILDFLTPLHRKEILVAESPAGVPVTQCYENYGFYRLQDKYKVKLLNIDEEPTAIKYVVDHRFRPQPVRIARLLLDPDTYIISSAVMKTHDRALVTLSLKNVVVGSAMKDPTFRWGKDSKGKNDKHLIHGGPNNEGIHYNLFQLGKRLHPDLSVIDGFEGMEHNGPAAGTPVDHKIAIASTDWLAADRIGVELMGFDFDKVGYLKFSADAHIGESDLDKMEILGEKVTDHIRRYRPHDSIEEQYKWITRGQKGTA